ncbi:MAG: HEPN domain-containing protein [Candidatus Hodarchaeales archaeon]|jgi:HEPN domain-containing protein
MGNRSSDWLQQAKWDLEHAKESIKLGHYEWACLAAQQAAEKSVKPLFIFLKAEVWGYGIARLLSSLPAKYSPEKKLIDNAKILDRHYIPSRYPNGLVTGTPRESYTQKDAQESIQNAKKIIEYCESQISANKGNDH